MYNNQQYCKTKIQRQSMQLFFSFLCIHAGTVPNKVDQVRTLLFALAFASNGASQTSDQVSSKTVFFGPIWPS